MNRILGGRQTLAIVLLLTFAWLAGCKGNGGDESDMPPTEEGEPITLSVYIALPLDDQAWNDFFVEPVKRRFPNVTLQKVPRVESGLQADLDRLLIAKEIPDIIFTSFGGISTMKDNHIELDLTSMVKDAGIDMEQFKPGVNEAFQVYADKGEIYALPLYMNVPVLLYNKDIFDKFGVGYPVDGMTWEQAVELGKRLTRTDGDVHYMGFHPGNHIAYREALSLPLVDMGTKRVVLDSPGWKRVFEFMKQAVDATQESHIGHPQAQDRFFKDQTLAMFPGWLNGFIVQFQQAYDAGISLKMDMVSQPTADGYNNKIDSHFLMVSATSAYPKEAFNIVSYLATSKEVQTSISQRGRTSALRDPEIGKAFASQLPVLKGKNTAVISHYKPAKPHVITPYDNILNKYVNQVINQVLNMGVDVNTAQREAAEAANLEFQAALKANAGG